MLQNLSNLQVFIEKKKSVPCLKDFITSSPKTVNLNSENENGPYI